MSEHQEQAKRLDDEADDLEQRSEELGDQISDVRENWEARRRDESVPGAPAPEGGDQDGETDPDREPWPDE
jgi:hypothetical protein